eukprot:384840-Pleurochrysis_carterae.AAC.1
MTAAVAMAARKPMIVPTYAAQGANKSASSFAVWNSKSGKTAIVSCNVQEHARAASGASNTAMVHVAATAAGLSAM